MSGLTVGFTNIGNPSATNDAGAIKGTSETAALFNDEYAHNLNNPNNIEGIRAALGITINEAELANAMAYLPDVNIKAGAGALPQIASQETEDLQLENSLEDAIASLDFEAMSRPRESAIVQNVKYGAETAADTLHYKIALENTLQSNGQTKAA